MSEYQTVLFELVDGVATVTLNRPEVLNSFDQRMLDEFADLWRRCRLDEDVRVVVLRAAGERAFSTGVDRKAGRTRHPNPWSADDPGFFLGAKQNRVWKPLICAVHGMCAGGAFYWVNEADVVICSSDATFFDPHTTYGMLSALEPAALARRIPFGEAMRIALFGLDERVGAARAHTIGLVSEVVPGSRAEVWARAQVLAERLAAKAPLAVQGSVKAIWDSLSMSPHAAREVPLVYPQLTNPSAQTEFTSGPRIDPEIR
ncbi:MAG TPA: enoyl-CoA hydratase/isomerase family protein [Pseudonocardia sp.]|jgi:enoyl-CoA hydratase/carnithine racemase|uniref:enoyl-CoA hydratase/isomerase family protein n=1 Tax=Pseudonocardia sp. TaxID=60912 RepID=UPI002BF8D8AE|nr:enoyl-CoA hydratase/isomerase family protein [Pseudonocardia sp.]HTF51751.1 enoyl-CoA hydratase/isomerase family protein [Pseudonocardia sp.]